MEGIIHGLRTSVFGDIMMHGGDSVTTDIASGGHAAGSYPVTHFAPVVSRFTLVTAGIRTTTNNRLLPPEDVH